MGFVISAKVRDKLLEKHGVTKDEVIECFANRSGNFLIDTREDHQTDPPSRWFISETCNGKRLKIVFVKENHDIFIKTAYSPNTKEERIYKKHAY